MEYMSNEFPTQGERRTCASCGMAYFPMVMSGSTLTTCSLACAFWLVERDDHSR